MALGIEKAGFDIALAIDYDGWHVATHKRNFPYGKAVCEQVQNLDAQKIRTLSELPDEIDLIFGGPPCQGFSNMGLRDTQDPRNSLIFHFARIVDEIRPKAFIMENVTGLNMGATKTVFESFLATVGDNYNVTLPVQVLSATDFCVPQKRNRLFVLGVRKDIGSIAAYPSPSADKTPSVKDAIADLPRVETDDSLFKYDSALYSCLPDQKNPYASIARGFSRQANDFSHERLWDNSRVSGCQRVKHTESAIDLYRATEPGGVVPGHKLPRLHPDGLCPTLRAGATSERGSHTAPRPIHPYIPRVITAREAARLHGYPDWFAFYPAKMHAYRQIGNSVCPPVAHAVGLKIIAALGIDPNSLTIASIKMEDAFHLPEDRPTQHARIPVKVEFPKIINYLWDKAYDIEGKKLRIETFGPDEIREAISSTGAQLPRVRPERFLYEAGQQRAIKDILEIPLKFGYSIAIVDKEKGLGRFQSADAPDSLGQQKSIAIKSAELNDATSIGGVSLDISSNLEILTLVEKPEFSASLSNGAWSKIVLAKDMFGSPETRPARAQITLSGGKIRPAHVEIFNTSSLLFERINASLSETGDELALILLRLTNHHLGASVVEKSGNSISEVFRKVFLTCEPALR